MTGARRVVEETARVSYGRLLAFLAARTRDVAAAEDALAEAFAAALEHWPRVGAPASPEAWLLTAARRKLIDGARRARTRADAEPDIVAAVDEAEALSREDRFVDERLKLLFLCAHPAIEASVRTPLMLQTVLGLDAARIASAFLVSPATMGQRLVRAKRKIAEARIPFEPPAASELAPRAAAVFDAIYAAFSAGYDAPDDADDGASDLALEAIFLARLAATLLPSNPEALGLLALMSYVEARRPARRADGRYVALDDQNTALWDRARLSEADDALDRAAAMHSPGRFQLEAAIQSAHVAGKFGQEDVREAVVRLYERLIDVAPTIGAEIARAAAVNKAGRAAEALAALDAIDLERIAAHQPYWATRAHVLAALDRRAEAMSSYDRAIGLSADAATRAFLATQKSAIGERR
jgi:RNA polymerase sigma-70 factor (ECF subfamily)